MVTQLQPDVRAYLHGGEVIKRYIKVEEVAYEYGFSVEETEYIAKAASSLYKLTRIHLVKKERFDEFMKHIYKVPGTNKQIIKKFARIGEASIIYSIGRFPMEVKNAFMIVTLFATNHSASPSRISIRNIDSNLISSFTSMLSEQKPITKNSTTREEPTATKTGSIPSMTAQGPPPLKLTGDCPSIAKTRDI